MRWGGQNRPTRYINSGALAVDVSPDDLATIKTIPVTVFTPAPGGGLSPEMRFVVFDSAGLGGPVRVYPNPFKASDGTPPLIVFDNLDPNAEVKIFTLSAHWVKSLRATNGVATWDLRNDTGENVASGYYFYVTKAANGDRARGKFALIR